MIDRTVFLELDAVNGKMHFAIESWFMPVDGPQESMRKIAIVIGDRVVLASKERALAISAAIERAARA